MEIIFQQYCKHNGKSHGYHKDFLTSNLPLDLLAPINTVPDSWHQACLLRSTEGFWFNVFPISYQSNLLAILVPLQLLNRNFEWSKRINRDVSIIQKCDNNVHPLVQRHKSRTTIFRSSHRRCPVKKGVLEISENAQKTPSPESLF